MLEYILRTAWNCQAIISARVAVCELGTATRRVFACRGAALPFDPRPPECILGTQLCDERPDCPGGEDETLIACLIRRRVLTPARGPLQEI